MKPTLEASVVIPLFNNEETAVKQLRECERLLATICSKFEIVVCDDKSTDSSANLLKRNFEGNRHFRLLFNRTNLGIAGNIRKLYKFAKYRYIVLFSVDGGWRPKDIARLLKYASKYNADIVIGKRTKKNYTLYRKIVSFMYNFLPYLFFGVKTEDAGSIKVIKKEIITSSALISKSVFFEAEVIIRAKKQKKKILSIPVMFNRKSGRSSAGKITLVTSSLLDLIKLRLSI